MAAVTRATWQGYIALGQLGIPVRLYSATQSTRPKFVQLHEKDGSPVERTLRCREERKEIDSSEIVRAVEHEPGKYITLTDRELDQSAPSSIKTIGIKQFADKHAVESLYYEKPFYIVPTKGGERAYALLREVFIRSSKVAVGQFIIYNQEHIAIIGVHGDVLMLQQLRFAAEILPRSNIKTPALPKPSPSEVEALSAVVDRFSGPFYIQDFHDEHTEHINELIERKIKGLSVPRRERIAPHATPEDEIVNALRSTINEREEIES